MSWKGHCKNALFALALTSLIAPQAEAIEIFMGANAATHINDDLFTQVRGGRGGGGGGMRHHGGGGMHRGGGCSGAACTAGCTGRAALMAGCMAARGGMRELTAM